MAEQINMMQAALDYAARGFAVFPVNQRNKKPHTPHGCLDAKTDPGAIRFWWTKWKDAAIGIATGSVSGGLIVVDLDEDDDKGLDGYQALKTWEKDHGEFPDTWRSVTGRGGYHIFFRSKKIYHNRAGVLDGVDVRGEGGYVIAPPSLHPNGRRYEWEISPDEEHLAEVTKSVDELLTYGDAQDGEFGQRFELPNQIATGTRNDTLFKYACSLQSKGVPNDAIVDYVRMANKMRCDDPLEDEDIDQIISSALRYEKGLNENEISFSGWREPKIETKEVVRNGRITRVPLQITKNYTEAIMYDKGLFGKIRHNKIAYAPCVCGELPWDKRGILREWNNTDDAYMKSYLESHYGLNVSEKVMDAITIVADMNAFNPVQEFLEQTHRDYIEAGSPQGKIRKLLPYYLGADDTDYVYNVMRIFMLGAISRAFHPGCKFDYVPILAGEQGAGKSKFFRYLAMSNDWFTDNFNTMETDKAAEKLRGMWILEMAELLAAKRTKDVEGIKAFLTSVEDNIRPPYGRRTERRPRICVFVGTTNGDHFLTDRTGNRRFLPVDVVKAKGHINSEPQERIQEEMRLAWGEAMQMFKDSNENPSLILPDEMNPYVSEAHEKHMEEDVRVGIIQAWLDKNKMLDTSESKNSRTCVVELWREALGNDRTPTHAETNAIHEIMQNYISGWVRMDKKVRCGTYGVQKCYELVQESDFSTAYDDDVPFP